MVRTPKPQPDPDRPGVFGPNGAAAKAGLNRSIHDAGWGVFLGILADKADSAGRRLIPVDPRNTSRTCPDCGHVSGDTASPKPSSCAWRADTPPTRTWSVRSTLNTGPGWSCVQAQPGLARSRPFGWRRSHE